MKSIALFVALSISLSNCSSAMEKEHANSGYSSDTTKISNSEELMKKKLSAEQYYVCHDKGTEAPFSGKYDNHWEKGIYVCAVCGTRLFDSETKFHSGSGWPSFFNQIGSNVMTRVDSSHGTIRSEILCMKCGSHLGHVFNDGPNPTGLRYCVNSLSLEFKSEPAK